MYDSLPAFTFFPLSYRVSLLYTFGTYIITLLRASHPKLHSESVQLKYSQIVSA
ncbi:hypothetical protein CY34DRAFT_814040 [Suillus luteus UH-Slu-Lm8-n1]|uniref:Uncharacterized protein n=1 Tax=Suillus luteus UH-Slu-Lm8-n1 TaxID=930992 RepID=A0A0D0ALR1_9AGAM|nr:hypothetical protein CY34DRAFT_814040 [Suillus luteus UH-Slu-Lm8-n1]